MYLSFIYLNSYDIEKVNMHCKFQESWIRMKSLCCQHVAQLRYQAYEILELYSQLYKLGLPGHINNVNSNFRWSICHPSLVKNRKKYCKIQHWLHDWVHYIIIFKYYFKLVHN